jgi:hypothetical protein
MGQVQRGIGRMNYHTALSTSTLTEAQIDNVMNAVNLSSEALNLIVDANISVADVLHAYDEKLLLSRLLNRTDGKFIAYRQGWIHDTSGAVGSIEDMLIAIDTNLAQAVSSVRYGKPCFMDNYAYVAEERKYYNLLTGAFYQKDAFNYILSEFVRQLVGSHMDEYMQPAAFFVSRPNKKMADGLGWRPSPHNSVKLRVYKDQNGKVLANSWHGFSIEPKDGDVKLWLDQIAHLCNGNQEYADIVAKRFAFDIQHPDKKASWGILFCGVPGAGKDAALKPIGKIFGTAYATVSSTSIKSPYDDEWFQRKIVQLSEISNVYGDAIEKLKSRITAEGSDIASLNIKSQGKVIQENLWSVYAATNNIDALELDENDRRWFVLDAHKIMPNPETYHAWLENDGANYLLQYLMHIDLSDFGHHKPPLKTQAFYDVKLATTWSLVEEIQNLVETDIELEGKELVAPKQLLLKIDSSVVKNLTLNSIKKALMKMGYRQMKQGAKKIDGKTLHPEYSNYFAKVGHPLLNPVVSPSEVYEAILAQSTPSSSKF